MKNFLYYLPTKYYLGDEAGRFLRFFLLPYKNRKILFCWGKGSIVKNGLYNQVKEICESIGVEILEFSGIMPNPTFEKTMQGVEIVKKNSISLILGVGGGSVIDCAKAISALAAYSGNNPWKLFMDKNILLDTGLTPVGAVLTVPATGSEGNGGCVLTNTETRIKNAYVNPLLTPRFAIANPLWGKTLSNHQIMAGSIDIISHCMEQLFSGELHSETTDNIALSIIQTMIKITPLLLKKYSKNLMEEYFYCSHLALNGRLKTGKGETIGFDTHKLSHIISGLSNSTHGETLGVLFPNWIYCTINASQLMRYKKLAKVFGTNMSRINEISNLTKKIREVYNSWGCSSSLKAFGLKEEDIKMMCERFMEVFLSSDNGYKGYIVKLTPAIITNILKYSFQK